MAHRSIEAAASSHAVPTSSSRIVSRIIPIWPVLLTLLIALVGLMLVLRSSPSWTLDLGEGGDSRWITGMLRRERDAANGTSFRWSEPEALVWLPGSEFGSYSLDFRAYHEAALVGERTLHLRRGGRDLGTVPMQEGWRVYRVLLPGSAYDAGLRLAPLELSMEAVRVPGDTTDRGMPLDWLRIKPTGQEPPWRALLLFWPLVLVSSWLWQLDKLWPLGAPERRGMRVAIPLAIVAGALIVWAIRAPTSLAVALPPTPWLLGSASVLLVMVWVAPWRARLSDTQRMWGSIGLLVIGQLLLFSQTAIWLGIALALVGMLLLPQQWFDWLSDTPTERASGFAPTLALLGLFVLALALRYYRLPELPYGLWRDEGRHALEAYKMLTDASYRPAYIPHGVDLPGLGLAPFAFAIKFLGIHAWTLRSITAFAGALAVLPLYGLVRRLYGVPAGLLAAALLACSHWGIAISRFSFPTIFDPLLQLTALWLLVVCFDWWRKARPNLALGGLFLAGACLGLALQTYHTGRIGLATAGLLTLLLALRAWQQWRRWTLGVATFGLGFVIAASPLIIYALTDPDAFNVRVGTVFLLAELPDEKSALLTKLDDAVGKHLLMFNVRGDNNGRHVNPDAPMLDALSGLGLLLGLAALLPRWRDWRTLFVLGAFAIGLAPSVLSVESPHAMRSIDALPIACLIGALGLIGVLRVMRARPVVMRSAALTSVLLVLVLNGWVYFVSMPSNPLVWTTSYPYHTQIGTYIRNIADTRGPEATARVYVPAALAENAVFEFLTLELPVHTFDERSLPQQLPDDALVVLPSTNLGKSARTLLEQRGILLDEQERGPLLPDASGPVFTAYRVKVP